ncbi:V-type proton ATPase subunit C 1-B-like [Dysidea avara]|uniref:V-type proton ATPase subunit C 1-B-like n=1 Tax=Dysidea avara TaxID=196820 RepID=UPI0033203A2B
MSSEYWLVSAPSDPTCEETYRKLAEVTSNVELTSNYKFSIPDLKVGTLDSLVALSDQLAKLDPFVEGLVRHVSQYIADILGPEDLPRLHENLLVGPGNNKVSMEAYLTKFQWENARFPPRQPLPSIVDLISKLATQIDGDLKIKSGRYNTLRSSLQQLERKATGNLLSRSLIDIVKPEDFVQDSEYLQTLAVCVPRSLYRDWERKYESLGGCDMIVPRSSKKLDQDGEFGLFTVTLFKKVVDEFKLHCREHKFIVRDFVYDPNAIKEERDEKGKLEIEMKKEFNPLMNWLKVNFSQAFSSWLHLKALRVFVESVLRYGLPVDFQAVLLKPSSKKAAKKLPSILKTHFEYLDTKAMVDDAMDDIDLPGLATLTQKDYQSYVSLNVNLNVLER